MHLRPTWSFQSDGTLWRILLSDRRKILGECRDEVKKETTFVCLDEQSGEVLWRHERPEDPWWIGLEAIHENKVLLHGFETPDMPEHKRIIALDLNSGKEEWRNDEVTFWFAYESRIYAYRTMFERRAGRVLDLNTGETLETLETIDEFIPLRQLARQEDVHESIDFPEALSDAGVPGEVRQLVDRETGSREIVGNIEAVVKDPFLVMNYHTPARGSRPEEPTLENRLAILDFRRRERLFSETLQTDARLPVPDSFFLKDAEVFFIKDRMNLSMLRLPLENIGKTA
jgi:hypothetical protein